MNNRAVIFQQVKVALHHGLKYLAHHPGHGLSLLTAFHKVLNNCPAFPRLFTELQVLKPQHHAAPFFLASGLP